MSDYTELNGNINYCMIYKELAYKARRLSTFHKNSYIKMKPVLLRLCKNDSSKELVAFLQANGYDIQYKQSVNSLIIDNIIKDKDTIILQL